MDGIKIEVTGNIARVTEKPRRITAGTVGLPVEFTFDSHWDGLSKTAVFTAGCKQMIVPNVVDTAIVPWELLQFPCVQLSIGVYGVDAEGATAIPTTWAKVCTIYPGADPGQDPSIKPTLNVWLKMLNSVGDLAKLATTAKDNLVNAINELHGKFANYPTAEEVNTTLEDYAKTEDVDTALANMRTLLWENASHISTFAPQTIGIPTTAYDAFDITFLVGNNTNCIATIRLTPYYIAHASNAFLSATIDDVYYSRKVTVYDASNEMSFDYSFYPSYSSDYCIPVRIYGIRFTHKGS